MDDSPTPTRVGVGLQLPVQAQSSRFAEPWEANAGPDELAAVAEACDRAGFWTVSVCDHVAVARTDAVVMGTTWYDTVATLGWLAARTTHVQLLSHVYVLPYRHPLVAAKAFATLDALSGGRVVLGVGAGHAEAEFGALGVEFATRGGRLDEAIDAVRTAFAEEYPSHDGEHWSFSDLGQRPRPVRPAGPPIWVGGSSPAAIRRAALRGDGWLPQGPPEGGMAAAIERLRALRRDHFGEEHPIVIGAHTEYVYVGASPNDLGRWEVSGSADAIAQRLRRHVAVGAHHLQLHIRTRSASELVDQVEAIGRDVLPLLNG